MVDLKSSDLLVIEPLCAATQESLSPLELSPYDHLFVKMTTDGSRFMIRAGAADSEGKPLPNIYPSFEARRFFNRIPERVSVNRGDVHNFMCGATDFTALVIKYSWPDHRVTYEDEMSKQLVEYLTKRFLGQTHRAEMIAKFKLNGEVPPPPKDWLEHKNPNLQMSDYQRLAIQVSMHQEGFALFMDRGTGKTATCIQRVCMEAARKKARGEQGLYRALIICPRQVRYNWEIELDRFATAPGQVQVVRGGQVTRLKQLVHGLTPKPRSVFTAVVASYDSVAASIEHFQKVPWDLIILDESHYIKSSKTERWRALRLLREKSKSRMVLTGTPIGNSPMDLWSQLEFLGEGLSGFSSFNAFKSFHGVYEEVGQGIQKLVGLKNVPLLQERLSRISFSISKEEAGLKLPDKLYDVIEVEMTPIQREIYSKVASEMAIKIESALSGVVNEMVVSHVLTMLLRLAQITSGHVVWDPIIDEEGNIKVDKRIERIPGENPKIDAVVELLTAEDYDPKGKMIIWCCFVEDIVALHERLESLNIKHGLYYGAVSQNDRDEVAKAFNNDPEMKVIIINPQCGGEGLDLIGYNKLDPEHSETYVNREIFFSQNWSSILRAQAEDRAHRRGARVPVQITDLVVPGSIDDEIRRRVKDKQVMADSVTDLRKIMEALVLRNDD